jgi:hypothetical protein
VIAPRERECCSERKKYARTAGAHHTFNLTVERKPDEARER